MSGTGDFRERAMASVRPYYQEPFRSGNFAPAQELARRVSRRWRAPIRAILVETTTFTLSRESLRTSTTVRRIDVKLEAGDADDRSAH